MWYQFHKFRGSLFGLNEFYFSEKSQDLFPFFILGRSTTSYQFIYSMKKAIFALLAVLALFQQAQAQDIPEWKVVTVVESIVPAGLGRSRMIENMTEINTDEYRTSRTNGTKSDQGSVRRQDIKVDEFDETKMLNFYSVGGINFRNIASNDAMIGSRIMELMAEGWDLKFVTSGVESDGGTPDGQGIFITRMFFSRPSQ